jgi:hypothetical protein
MRHDRNKRTGNCRDGVRARLNEAPLPKKVAALRTTHNPPPDRSRVLANFVGMLNNLHGMRPRATCNDRLGTADSPRANGPLAKS